MLESGGPHPRGRERDNEDRVKRVYEGHVRGEAAFDWES